MTDCAETLTSSLVVHELARLDDVRNILDAAEPDQRGSRPYVLIPFYPRHDPKQKMSNLLAHLRDRNKVDSFCFNFQILMW
jgi:hypothetical protein